MSSGGRRFVEICDDKKNLRFCCLLAFQLSVAHILCSSKVIRPPDVRGKVERISEESHKARCQVA